MIALVVMAGASASLAELALGEHQANEAAPAMTAERAYAKLPMSFVANHGQLPEGIGFGAQGAGYRLGLRPTEAVLALSRSRGERSSTGVAAEPLVGHQPSLDQSQGATVVQMQLVGANAAARPRVDVPLPGKANYLTGDPSRRRTGLPTHGQVTYEGVYPGVDVSYHGHQGEFEYDFIIAPGASPAVVNLRFAGVDDRRLDDHGDLVLTIAGTELRHRAPVIYQEGRTGREPVPGAFVMRDDGGVGFTVGPYDRSRPLVIDPTLVYSTFLGSGGFDFGLSIAVDHLGNAYVAGATTSLDFPTTPGAYDTSFNGNQDGFVAKLNPTGSALLYSTYLGGSGLDDADSVAVDLRGQAYVRGVTVSPDFPTTPGAFDQTFNGGFDAFVTKLSADGSSLAYSSLLGGTGFDSGSGIAVDRLGAAYVPGITGSPEFPTTPGAFQTTFHGVGGPLPPLVGPPGDYDAYVTKLAPDGSRLEYSTFLGGSGLEAVFEVALNPFDEAYVVGTTFSGDFPTTPAAYDRTLAGPRDAFVTRLNRNGTAAVYSTFLGGSSHDGALGLGVDRLGNAYVAGMTLSPDFPTTPGSFDRTFNGASDAYVTKLNPQGSALVYSTFLGGAGPDSSSGLAVNLLGQAYVTGSTGSPDFPTSADAPGPTPRGDSDAFLSVLSRNGTAVLFSTYLGGSGFDAGADVAADFRGAAYVAGETASPDFPSTPGAFDTTHNGGDEDAFVTKFSAPPFG